MIVEPRFFLPLRQFSAVASACHEGVPGKYECPIASFTICYTTPFCTKQFQKFSMELSKATRGISPGAVEVCVRLELRAPWRRAPDSESTMAPSDQTTVRDRRWSLWKSLGMLASKRRVCS